MKKNFDSEAGMSNSNSNSDSSKKTVASALNFSSVLFSAPHVTDAHNVEQHDPAGECIFMFDEELRDDEFNGETDIHSDNGIDSDSDNDSENSCLFNR